MSLPCALYFACCKAFSSHRSANHLWHAATKQPASPPAPGRDRPLVSARTTSARPKSPQATYLGVLAEEHPLHLPENLIIHWYQGVPFCHAPAQICRKPGEQKNRTHYPIPGPPPDAGRAAPTLPTSLWPAGPGTSEYVSGYASAHVCEVTKTRGQGDFGSKSPTEASVGTVTFFSSDLSTPVPLPLHPFLLPTDLASTCPPESPFTNI